MLEPPFFQGRGHVALTCSMTVGLPNGLSSFIITIDSNCALKHTEVISMPHLCPPACFRLISAHLHDLTHFLTTGHFLQVRCTRQSWTSASWPASAPHARAELLCVELLCVELPCVRHRHVPLRRTAAGIVQYALICSAHLRRAPLRRAASRLSSTACSPCSAFAMLDHRQHDLQALRCLTAIRLLLGCPCVTQGFAA